MSKTKYNLVTTMSANSVRAFCIKHQFYTRGDCKAYEKMLDYVSNHFDRVTTNIVARVAEDIINHTDMGRLDTEDMDIESMMFLLDKECINRFYERV